MSAVNLTSEFQSFKNPEGVSERLVRYVSDRSLTAVASRHSMNGIYFYWEIVMREKKCGTYEVLLYIGSKEGYKGKAFSREDLFREIGLFQDVIPNSLPVRVSPCTYIAGSNYQEDGHEISAIMYPNQLRTYSEIDNFMTGLAKHLMQTFKQNRITVRKLSPEGYRTDSTIMFESEEAEVSKSIQNFNNANNGITGS